MKKIVLAFSIVALLLFFVYLFLPNKSDAPEVNPNTVCRRHMSHIHGFMVDYHKKNGVPLTSVVQDGDRLLSWRYVMAKEMITSSPYSSSWYHWDAVEPWNDTYNMEEIAFFSFCCYVETNTSKQRKVSDTSYLMLLHSEENVSDLPARAVIVVESADCGIHWMEPKDISIETLRKADSPFGQGLLNSYHDDYVNVLCKNGNIVRISKKYSKDKVIAILEGKGKR